MTGLTAAPGCAADLTSHDQWDAGDTGCGELVLELRSAAKEVSRDAQDHGIPGLVALRQRRLGR